MSEYSISKENYEIRAESRRILSGNWGQAVLVVLVIFLISGISGSISGSFTNSDGSYVSGALLVVATILSLMSIVYTILVVNVLNYGFVITYLQLCREGKIVFENLFKGFKDYGRVVAVMFLKKLLIFLWTLLFIIPGIIKTYAYSMTEYILMDNPGMDALTAISKSKEMMSGWKGKLFLLDLSLIGWWFLSLLTCGIGYLWLASYFLTNRAVFYQEMTGGAKAEPIMENPDDLVIEAAQKEIERINREESDLMG